MRFGMFFLAEFIEIVTSSAIMITLFFGGWHWGRTIDGFLASAPAEPRVRGGDGHRCGLIKVFAFCWFQLLIRWSLPRFRSDQLMRLGWQRLLPLSIANIVATALIILWAQT